MKRIIVFAVLAIALSLGVAACGGDDNDSGSTASEQGFKVPDIPAASDKSQA